MNWTLMSRATQHGVDVGTNVKILRPAQFFAQIRSNDGLGGRFHLDDTV